MWKDSFALFPIWQSRVQTGNLLVHRSFQIQRFIPQSQSDTTLVAASEKNLAFGLTTLEASLGRDEPPNQFDLPSAVKFQCRPKQAEQPGGQAAATESAQVRSITFLGDTPAIPTKNWPQWQDRQADKLHSKPKQPSAQCMSMPGWPACSD